MKNIKSNTSVIELFRNGIFSTRTMNFCRRMDIESVEDLLSLINRYGSLEKKFGRGKSMCQMQLAVNMLAA